ncbi:unnamed protein product [Scytosiphon promiscuus]
MPEAERREVDKMLRGLAPKHQRQLSVSSSNALERFAVIEAVLCHRKLVLLLDYDGTLTPIVKDPSKALLSDRVRAVLKELPKHFITGVISGRSLGKIRAFVDVKGLFYAGSHGFDILAPSHSAYSGASGIERSGSPVPREPSTSSPSSPSPSEGAAAAALAGAAGATGSAVVACAACFPTSNGNGVNGGGGGGVSDFTGGKAAPGSRGTESEPSNETDAESRGGETGGDEKGDASGKSNASDDEDGGNNASLDTGAVLEEVRHQVAQEYLPVMETIRDELIAELKGIEKSEVEDNRFSVSIHYRNCARADVPKVKDVVERVQKRHERIRMGSGKEVFELQPDIEWDKGKAVLWLLDKLVLPMAKASTDEAAAAAAQDEEVGDEESERFFTIFIGDDKTDENAFRALNGDMGAAGGSMPHEGVGILVSEESRETNAAYTLRNPDEVASFLEKIAELGHERCRSRCSGGGGDSER